MVIRISDKTQNYSKVTKLLVKPCFISILGIFVLIYQTKLLFKDIKDKQQKKEN